MNRGGVSVIALVISLGVGAVVAQAPIPARPPGFIYKHAPDALVTFEAFVDLICPNSKAAWKTYQAIADHYGTGKLQLSTLFFPLPYHRAAMMAAQGAFIANEIEPGRAYQWFDNVFEKQATLYDDAIFNKTQEFIVETLGEWAGEVGYNQSVFTTHLARSDQTQQFARVQFKYGGTRGVFGTPETFINGVFVESKPTWTLEDWIKIIDPLIAEFSRIEQAQKMLHVIKQVRIDRPRNKSMVIIN